jgi:hypothetical protein
LVFGTFGVIGLHLCVGLCINPKYQFFKSEFGGVKMSQSIIQDVSAYSSSPDPTLVKICFEQLEEWCGLQEQREWVDGVETVVPPEDGPTIVPVLVGFDLARTYSVVAQSLFAASQSEVKYQPIHFQAIYPNKQYSEVRVAYSNFDGFQDNVLPIKEFSITKLRRPGGVSDINPLDLNDLHHREAAVEAMVQFRAKHLVGGSIGSDSTGVPGAHVIVAPGDDVPTIARAMAEILGPSR